MTKFDKDENGKFICVCGRSHKERRTVLVHQAKADALKLAPPVISKVVETVEPVIEKIIEKAPIANIEIVTPINLQKEEKQMADPIITKPETAPVEAPVKIEPERVSLHRYQCGKCKSLFEAASEPAKCPYCNVTF